jgi:hypothetical protein
MPKKRRKKGYSAYRLDWSPGKELSSEEAIELCKKHNLNDAEELKRDFAVFAMLYRNNKQCNSGPTPVIMKETAQAIAKHATALIEELDGLDGSTHLTIKGLNVNQFSEEKSRAVIDLLIRHGIIQKIINGDGDANLDVGLIFFAVKTLASQAQKTVDHFENLFKEKGTEKFKFRHKSTQHLMNLAANLREYWNKQTGKDITCGFEEMDECGEAASIPKSNSAKFFVDLIRLIDADVSQSQVRRVMSEHIKLMDKTGKYKN